MWLDFRSARLALHFRYPAATADGHSVLIRHEDGDRYSAVRVTAAWGDDPDLEIARFPGTDPGAMHRYLEHEPQLAIGETVPARFHDHAAWTFELRDGAVQRRVYLVPVGSDLYRITFDPEGDLNEQILATVVFT